MPYSRRRSSEAPTLQGFVAQVIMRKVIVCVGLVLCALVALSGVSSAQTPPPVNVNRPAATLLLPYFEVDLDNPSGRSTLFTINNASATAVLAHVTVWSDMAVPVFGFNVYLTGYDVETIDVRQMLTDRVPRTASVGQDPGDTISNQGSVSQDINFASCSGKLPPPPLPTLYKDYLRAALTGAPSSFHGGQCVARSFGEPSVARGYITVDTVNNCTLRMPNEPGYFVPGNVGDATGQNVLWGDFSYVDRSQNLEYGDSLVHIAAHSGVPVVGTPLVPGDYSFYGRFSSWTAADQREPLATNFAARFIAPKDFKTPDKSRRRSALPPSTEFVVWRDTKSNPNAFACNSAPPWFPLSQEDIVVFDEQENPQRPNFLAQPFPAATQKVTVASTAFPVTAASGWAYLNLNTWVISGPPGLSDPAAAQAWVSVLQRVQQGPNGGRYDVGFHAVRLDTARQASHQIFPLP